MAFKHLSAPAGLRPVSALSADNIPPACHQVISMLRKCASHLGLTPPVVATLEALLSFLPPSRNHHIVFASNATLTERRNGITDRTLRRHISALQEARILARCDSANRKRFIRRDPVQGHTIRFGLDLAPLFQRLPELTQLAEQAEQDKERLGYLKSRLRASVQQKLAEDPQNEDALDTLKVLRRRLNEDDLTELLARFEPPANEARTEDAPAMSGTDSQNVRHHHSSIKEPMKKKAAEPLLTPPDDVMRACPDATAFLPAPVSCPRDIIDHGRALAGMIGIQAHCYNQAETRHGPYRTAVVVWAMVQMANRISNIGAYFRSITIGRRSTNFSAERLVHGLLKTQERAGA